MLPCPRLHRSVFDVASCFSAKNFTFLHWNWHGPLLFGFRQFLLKRIGEERYSPLFARDVLASFKQFTRWLASSTDRLEHLPKNIDDRQLAIVAGAQKAKTLTPLQIKTVMASATDRTQLYLLLGLNCAMTQQDMADLKPSEVDWTSGTITRKRSKTGDFESVPEVTYQLWPSTAELLRKQRSKSKELVLLTNNGTPICAGTLADDGTYKKTDAVRFLAKKTSIEFTMKSFKKTSASLIRNNPKYNGIESLFLGHATKSMSDRYYTTPPQDLLDEAIAWLGEAS